MHSTSHPPCPSCGRTIPDGAPEGLCPRCLMLGAAEPAPPAPAGATLPTREEIAPAFPGLEVGEMIGHGGMGAVFRARQPKLERDVALKVLPRALAADPSFAERFHREARALAKLNHPNIVTVHDYGEQGGWYYLLMELVDGVNLRQAMRTKRFTPEQALQIVPPICAALEYAHGEGVLHRDIKPENLLLDSRGRVKIADFGIAKLGQSADDELTLTVSGARLGTMAYMAPEQIERPGSVDHRADIYSLGVVFYEMLTGELPIGRFAAPSEKSPVGAQVDEVVFRTLEKSPERRFQSAGEMQTQVETLSGKDSAGSGGPVPPPPPPPEPPAAGDRPRRWTGPGMALFLFLFAAFAGLGLLIGVQVQQAKVSRMVYANAVAHMNDTRAGFIALGVGIAGLVLAGSVLGWMNLVRLRLSVPPRSGLMAATVPAGVPALVLLWLLFAINIHDEPLAWLDGIAVTCLLVFWFVCWINPRPLPWNIKAVLAVSFIMAPVPLIAHGWRSHAHDVDNRWAQESDLLQININELGRMEPGSQGESRLQNMVQELNDLRLQGRPAAKVPFSSRARAYFALAGCFAVAGTLLGWMARVDFRHELHAQRGRALAEFAAWFWPLAAVPLLLFLA